MNPAIRRTSDIYEGALPPDLQYLWVRFSQRCRAWEATLLTSRGNANGESGRTEVLPI